MEEKIWFCGEWHDYKENEDGSKIILKERNKNGFKITVRVSGDKEEHEEGLRAVRDFFVKGVL